MCEQAQRPGGQNTAKSDLDIVLFHFAPSGAKMNPDRQTESPGQGPRLALGYKWVGELD